MEKKTKRLGFNFLRSYFDVVNEIDNDADKLSFLMAVINKQFLHEDPKDMNFLVNLCYQSQKHAIEKSVKGWVTANKTDLQGNPIPPPKGDPKCDPKGDPKEEQVQEKEKEEEETNSVPLDKPKTLIDFKILLEFINKKTARGFKVINSSLKNKYKARLKEGYTKDDIKKAIENACIEPYHKENNLKYLTPEFFSRATTIDKYSTILKNKKEPITYNANNF